MFGDDILKATIAGNLKLLRDLRNEAGDDEAFRRKCERAGAGAEGLTCLPLLRLRGEILRSAGNKEVMQSLLLKCADIEAHSPNATSPLSVSPLMSGDLLSLHRKRDWPEAFYRAGAAWMLLKPCFEGRKQYFATLSGTH
ncbi:hypothetical protein PHJA_001825800 [Phtheirospermum japonicum]|uniref:Uncharacterized protein n=1 Tax=Phtheirospermum japonicum TaxID=374723 RepID=A0A830C7X3_9LAMI|nr:hypothetical protein PHJA_001825800 [Phtheirospermum japonicum]